MPLSAISLERLELVHPKLRGAIMEVDFKCQDLNIQVTQGLRTWEEQDQLYAQGRTAPGEIITNARGGESWHNFAMAIDLVPRDISTGQPDWDISHPSWTQLVSVGEMVGLTSGSAWRTFPDWPHFQLTGRFPVNPDDEVREIYKRGGINLVWQESGI